MRQLRREREMTQSELGRRVNLATATISAIEAGDIKPSLDKAFAIAHVFGLPVEQVFEYITVPA